MGKLTKTIGFHHFVLEPLNRHTTLQIKQYTELWSWGTFYPFLH